VTLADIAAKQACYVRYTPMINSEAIRCEGYASRQGPCWNRVDSERFGGPLPAGDLARGRVPDTLRLALQAAPASAAAPIKKDRTFDLDFCLEVCS
jgi:hypothetical protein